MIQTYIAFIQISVLWRNVYILTWMLWLLGFVILVCALMLVSLTLCLLEVVKGSK